MRVEKRVLNDALRVLGKVVCQTSLVERYKFINEVVEKITVHIDRVEIEYKTDGLEAVITETEAANEKNN